MVGLIQFSDLPRVKMRSFLDELKTGEQGLTDAEISEKRKKYGYNEIVEKKKNPLLRLLGYFWGPIPLMIEAAAILSLLIHHYTDFYVILALLLVNVLVGFWHDHKAGNAIELLKQKLAPQARILRNKKWSVLPARELVPGDIIRIRLGDIVPADVKLIKGDYLECDESSLTGESLPVDKHIGENAFSGSVVTRGEMTAVVTATGLDTYFGKTAKLVDRAEKKSHFEQAVLKIGNYLILLAAVLIIVLLFVTISRHENLMETMRFMMVLAVASIPVALPAILTITMAIGAVNLAKKRAIVSKLAAIEELAGVDILCSDKTGTLTKNRLTIGKPFASKNFTAEDTLLYAILASREDDNDAIDNAILVGKKRAKIANRLLQYTTTEFIPFDPLRKRTEVSLINSAGDRINVSKGAPQAIAEICSNSRSNGRHYLEQKVEDFAQMGYRTIAVAQKTETEDWHLVGLIPLFDPPRDDSAKTVMQALDMGIKIKMITGDNIAIARQISQKLGLNSKIRRGEEIKHIPQYQMEDMVEEADGFAEAYPEHKYSIVKVLQKLNHLVGMTGDGVNDAPALKNADCGIAVAGATDAAKSAASMVLTAPGLSVIIDAIRESRKIFQRMNSYAIYRIAETIRVLFFITLSIIVFNFYPVTAIMIVLLALLNDVPIIAIAGDNVIYSKKPEKWNMPFVLGLATFLGILGVVSSFIVFYLGKDLLHLNADVLQSFIFLKLAVAGHLTIFISRTRSYFWSLKPSQGLFWSALITKTVATFFAIYGWFIAPIGWQLAAFVWVYALIAFVLTDLLKVYFLKKFIPVYSG